MKSKFIATFLCATLMLTSVVYADDVSDNSVPVQFEGVETDEEVENDETETVSEDVVEDDDAKDVSEESSTDDIETTEAVSEINDSDSHESYDSVSNDSLSDNSLSDNSLSDNAISENEVSSNEVSENSVSSDEIDALGDDDYQSHIKAEVDFSNIDISVTTNPVNNKFYDIVVRVPLNSSHPYVSKCDSFFVQLNPEGVKEDVSLQRFTDGCRNGVIQGNNLIFKWTDCYAGYTGVSKNINYKVARIDFYKDANGYSNTAAWFEQLEFWYGEASTLPEKNRFLNTDSASVTKVAPYSVSNGNTEIIPSNTTALYKINTGSYNQIGVKIDGNLFGEGMEIYGTVYDSLSCSNPVGYEASLNTDTYYYVYIYSSSKDNHSIKFITYNDNYLEGSTFYEYPSVTSVMAGGAFTGTIKMYNRNGQLITSNQVNSTVVQMYDVLNAKWLIGTGTYSSGAFTYNVPTTKDSVGGYEFSVIYIKDANEIWHQVSKRSEHTDYKVLSVTEMAKNGYTGKNDTTTMTSNVSGTVTINAGTKATLKGKKGTFKITKGAKCATVSKTGKITFKKKGKVVVKYTASDGTTVVKTINVKVPSLKASKKTVKVGKCVTVSLKGCDMINAKWSVKKASLATIVPSADNMSVVLTAKKKGKATITAKIGSKKYTTVVTIN